jgi:superfamily II DNA/RNA helicase
MAEYDAVSSDEIRSHPVIVSLGISDANLLGLEGMGIASLTEVQCHTLPVIVGGQDVLAKAKTGTGKYIIYLGYHMSVFLSYGHTISPVGSLPCRK